MDNNDNPLMVFDLPQEQASIIKVVGVGGGGSNAVNHMFESGISDVNFIVCNTDKQALDLSNVPNKIQLGKALTEGRGAGMDPEKGKNATLESIDELRSFLERGTRMVFITACMGKGTGTGGAPVIAKLAREMGILTVALVTMPFSAEGPKRFAQADSGIEEMKSHVDALIVISNDKLREIYGNLKLTEAFGQANNVLLNAARGIAEIISTRAKVNVDFEDVSTVMRNSGVAIMGIGVAEGDNRALNAVESALTSPLLNDNHIKGARNVLINISDGEDEITVDELTEINEYVQREAGFDTNIIWGHCTNENLGNKLSVTIIATGFEAKPTQRVHTHIPVAQPIAAEPKTVQTPRHREVKKVEEVTAVQVPVHQQPTIFDLEAPVTLKTEEAAPTNTPALPDNSAQASPIMSSVQPASLPNNSLNTQNTVEHVFPHDDTQINAPDDDGFQIVHKDLAQAEQEAMANAVRNERIAKLKGLSIELRHDSAYYEDLEKQPAYMRRQVNLKDYPAAADSQRSEYVINSNENTGAIELRKDNGFLHGHDKVD